jgi:hypothetical protein
MWLRLFSPTICHLTAATSMLMAVPRYGSSSAALCDHSVERRVIRAYPSTYRKVLPTLRPGDTLFLAAGTYPLLRISHLRGTPLQCIAVTGPPSGARTVIEGTIGRPTVKIANSSYVAIKNLTIDSRGVPGAFGISADGGQSNITHHILIEGNTLVGQGGSQQTDGISTKAPTWAWVIRKNRIIGAGTGIYLGNSNGKEPFVAGVIEDNLIINPIGYCMEVKYQLPRPSVSGMPTAPSSTLIRNNVFIKDDQPSPDGDRPNLLVGGFPDSGPGSNDLYEIYGNFFYHNSREVLFQGSGRISFHDNILVSRNTAALFRNHDLPLKLAYVYNNTIYTARAGIEFGNAASDGDAVVGNLIFAATPTTGPVAHQAGNIMDSFGNAAKYVNSPSFELGAMNFYPLAGKTRGAPLDLSQFASNADYNVDFNRSPKGTMTLRGAYAGAGTNPGWRLQADVKPAP